jgi:tetratricopeptide (TPR) repeat protein
MRRFRFIGSSLTIFLFSSTLLWAQGMVSQKLVGAPPPKPRLGQAGSQQELDAYNRMHNQFDPNEKKNLIDQFVRDYPDSGLLAYAYQDGVYLGRRANNIEMMAQYGEKSLELWPENFTLLTELGSVYVQRERINEAELKAQSALDLLESAERPAYMAESQWAEVRRILISSNCSTLGFVHLRRALASKEAGYRKSEAEGALSWFVRAQQMQPLDDFTLYGFGFAYVMLNDYPNAESNLAKAVAVNGIVMASARTLLEEIYKSQHNQSLNGLEQIITRAKADLRF